MRSLLTVVGVLASFQAMAEHDVFSHGDCQRLSQAEHEKVRVIDGGISEQAARAAEQELHLRLAAKLTDPPRLHPSAGDLAATLEGWLIKKEWLGALARREHDADEAVAYCEFVLRRAGIE